MAVSLSGIKDDNRALLNQILTLAQQGSVAIPNALPGGPQMAPIQQPAQNAAVVQPMQMQLLDAVTPKLRAADVKVEAPALPPAQGSPLPESKTTTGKADAKTEDSTIDVGGAIRKKVGDDVANAADTARGEVDKSKKELQQLHSMISDLFGKTTADANEVKQATAGKKDSGGGIGSMVGDVIDGALSIIGWIICTELMVQGRLPRRWWITGSKVFAGYNEYVKQGYYLWAVPSVLHLRARPHSLYSRFLCTIFNWRAENIAAHAGVKGARKLYRGAAVTVCLWPICFVLGVFVRATGYNRDWRVVYAQKETS